MTIFGSRAIVSPNSFRAIYDAFLLIEGCNGGINRDRPVALRYDVPDPQTDLAEINAALADLSDDEMLVFCDGDEDNQVAIAARSRLLGLAKILLTEFFESGHEDWRANDDGRRA